MTHDEREKFWNTICSLPGRDICAEREKLLKTIKFPKYLYRYRPVNTKNLEALRTNRLYFSSANYYDDPFDTFLHIDIEELKKEYLSILRFDENAENKINYVNSLLGGILNKEQLSQFNLESLKYAQSSNVVDEFLSFALALRSELKKDVWSVCFSENGFNESLWLKYADQHKGFVLIYDLENDDNYLCGKQQKCSDCGIKNFGTPLYPIYYSDSPYNATNFAKFVMLRKAGELTKVSIPKKIYESLGAMLWEIERIILIKKECHKYDEEWRMITGCPMKPPILMEWIPSGLILGLKMDLAEENLVVSLAKAAGIKNIYKSYINTKNELDAYKI